MIQELHTTRRTSYIPDAHGVLTFKGVKIGSPLSEFAEVLKRSGCEKAEEGLEKYAEVYYGSFATFKRCRIELEYTPISNRVYVVRIDIDDISNDDMTHIDRYKLIRNLLRERYKNTFFKESKSGERPRVVTTLFEFSANQSIILKVSENFFYMRYMDESYTSLFEEEEKDLIIQDL